jgi:hypothetical protein
LETSQNNSTTRLGYCRRESDVYHHRGARNSLRDGRAFKNLCFRYVPVVGVFADSIVFGVL